MRALGLIKRLWRDRDGVSAVEAAIGLPILLTLLIGVLEISYLIFLSVSLENAVLRASRFGITGGAEEGVTREELVRSIIAEQTFGQVDMNEIEIETLVYEQFGDIGEAEPIRTRTAAAIMNPGNPSRT